MSPKNDSFLTASQDGSCRLWDVRTNVCSGALRCSTASPVATFDHQGLVFAVVTADGVLKMFDAREYDKGPFDVCVFDAGHHVTPPGTATSISFTLDGKQLLLSAGGHIYVLDAFNGQRLQCIPIPQAPNPGAYALPPPPCEPCFTPDGRCVVSGAPDGLVHIWNAATGAEVLPPWRGHAGVPSCLRWSPTRCLAASGCTAGGLALWIPAPEGAQQHARAASGTHFAAQGQGLMAAMQPVMQGMW
jgi:COMPASS component SWD2